MFVCGHCSWPSWPVFRCYVGCLAGNKLGQTEWVGVWVGTFLPARLGSNNHICQHTLKGILVPGCSLHIPRASDASGHSGAHCLNSSPGVSGPKSKLLNTSGLGCDPATAYHSGISIWTKCRNAHLERHKRLTSTLSDLNWAASKSELRFVYHRSMALPGGWTCTSRFGEAW